MLCGTRFSEPKCQRQSTDYLPYLIYGYGICARLCSLEMSLFLYFHLIYSRIFTLNSILAFRVYVVRASCFGRLFVAFILILSVCLSVSVNVCASVYIVCVQFALCIEFLYFTNVKLCITISLLFYYIFHVYFLYYVKFKLVLYVANACSIAFYILCPLLLLFVVVVAYVFNNFFFRFFFLLKTSLNIFHA